jgi:hypothetical protein
MLNGTNNKCSKCSQFCKQWNQVKVLICPNYISTQRQAQENVRETLGETFFGKESVATTNGEH